MSERHKRKNAREMLTKAGYKIGGHFAKTKGMIGEAVREHEDADHEGKPHTKLKLKDGGAVTSAAFGARIHKPRGMGKGKKPHTTVNVVVAGQGGGAPKPVPVPVPIGGPPPIGPGAGMPPGGLPGQMPGGPMPGAKRGGRFAKGGSVKEDSQRDPIRNVNGRLEGKLKKGGRAKDKYLMGGPIAPNATMGMGALPPAPIGPSPSASVAPPIGALPPAPVGPGMAAGVSQPGGLGNTLMRGNPMAMDRSMMKRGGKAKAADPEMTGGGGGGLGRLQKAEEYGAKVKRGGKAR